MADLKLLSHREREGGAKRRKGEGDTLGRSRRFLSETAAYSIVTPTTRQAPPSRISDSVSIAPALLA